MIPEAEGLLGRLRSALGGGSLFDNLDEWITKHTRLDQLPFSFKDHEFQREIVNDVSHEKVVRKCSQVGLSEVQVRIMLGLLALSNRYKGIFVLPTSRFAQKFAKDRFDPVIKSSEYLQNLIVPAADSSEMKQIGNATLYIGGSVGQQAAISVPASVLFVDEFDFCDQTVVSTYSSRLRHAEDGGFKHKFSTPTVPGYGISREFDLSDQKHYMVCCEHCNEWQTPDYYRQLIIPGFDDSIDKFEKIDLENPNYDTDGAYLCCIKCGKDLFRSLTIPERRAWVPKYLNRRISGFSVSPFDLPKYNSPSVVLRQMGDYKRKQDFFNFVLGIPFRSRETQILDEIVEESTTLRFLGPNELSRGNTVYMGVDVGKVSHYVVLIPSGKKLHVVAYGSLALADGELSRQIIEMGERYSVSKLVIDAGPDFSTAKKVVEHFTGDAFACTYTRATRTRKLDYYEINEAEGTLSAQRTKAIDQFVEHVNSGMYRFPQTEEQHTFGMHLQAMRRVQTYNDVGETVDKWEKISTDDHYFHACVYAELAWQLDGARMGTARGPVSLAVGSVKLQDKPDTQTSGNKEPRILPAGLMGLGRR